MKSSPTADEKADLSSGPARWARVVPIVFVTYSLAYLDRANYGLGAAAGLAKTLDITPSRSALLGALFFLGYFVFQVPGAAYARGRSVRKLVFWAQLGWGILAALTGILHNFWLLALDRLLLGATEGVVIPALLVLITDWFTRRERSRANTLLTLGNPITMLWMSVVTGYLIKAVGWQMAFVVEGLPSIVWAFFWLAWISDHPSEATWLKPEGRAWIASELAAEQRAIPPIARTRDALRSRHVMLLSAQYLLWGLGVYGFILWLPTIIEAGAARGIATTGLLSAVPYAAAIPLMLFVSHQSDKRRQRGLFIWPLLIFSGIAFFLSYATVGHNFWLAYFFLIIGGATMYAPYGPFFAIVPEILPKNVSGQALAFINSFGALGSFLGTWLIGFLEAKTHSSEASFLAMAVSLVCAGLIMLCLPRAKAFSLSV